MSIENLMTSADTYVPLAEVTNAHSVNTPDSLIVGVDNPLVDWVTGSFWFGC